MLNLEKRIKAAINPVNDFDEYSKKAEPLKTIERTDEGWKDYEGTATPTKTEYGGSYLAGDEPDTFIRPGFRDEGTFDPVYNFKKRQGVSSGLFQIDHVVPISLSGSDTEENKVLLSITDHKQKTKVGAVANELYFNKKIDLGTAQKLAASEWKDRDVSGIELNDKGGVDQAVAERVYQEWTTGRKTDTSESGGWKDKYSSFFGKNPLAEFAKGAASELALGYLPSEASEYEIPREQTIANVSKTVGQIAGFIGSMALVYGAVGKIAKGLGVAAKAVRGGRALEVPNILKNLTSAIPRVSKGKIIVPRGTIGKTLSNMGVFATRGQLAKQEEGVSRSKRFLEDSVWGVVGGVTGQSLKSYGRLAAATYLISAVEGANPKEAAINTAIMVGLHGTARPSYIKSIRKKATIASNEYRAKFGIKEKDLTGKSNAEIAKIIDKDNKKALDLIEQTYSTPEDIIEAKKNIIMTGRNLYNDYLPAEQGLKEEINDIKSLFTRQKLMDKTYTDGYVPDAYHLADINNAAIEARNKSIMSKEQGTANSQAVGEQVTTGVSSKVSPRTNRDINDYINNDGAKGDMVYLVRRDDLPMVNITSKKGYKSPEKNIQVIGVANDNIYSLGFLPRETNIPKINERITLKKQSPVSEKTSSEGVYDMMLSNEAKVMPAEISSIGVSAKKSGEPWVRVNISNNDVKATKSINELFTKQQSNDVFEAISTRRPTKAVEKKLEKESVAKGTEKMETMQVVGRDELVINGKEVPVASASEKISKAISKNESTRPVGIFKQIESEILNTKNDALKAAKELGITGKTESDNYLISTFIEKARTLKKGKSEVSVPEVIEFFKKMKTKNQLDTTGKAINGLLQDDKSFYNKFKKTFSKTPLFEEAIPAQPRPANMKPEAMKSAEKITEVKEPTIDQKKATEESFEFVEKRSLPAEKVEPIKPIKDEPIPVSKVEPIEKVEPVKALTSKAKTVSETIKTMPTAKNAERRPLPVVESEPVSISRKFNSEDVDVKPKNWEKYDVLKTKEKQDQYRRFYDLAMNEANNVNVEIGGIEFGLQKATENINKIVRGANKLNSSEKQMIVDQVKLHLDDYKAYLGKLKPTGAEHVNTAKLGDDTFLLESVNMDKEGILINPVQVKKVKGEYVIVPENENQANLVQKTWHSTVGEKPVEREYGFSKQDNQLSMGINKAIIDSEGPVKAFYSGLKGELDSWFKWMKKPWGKLKLKTTRSIGENITQSEKGLLENLNERTFLIKENELEYANAIRSKRYDKIPVIKKWEALRENGVDVGSFKDFYKNYGGKIKDYNKRYPEIISKAEEQGNGMVEAIRKVEKENPGKRVSVFLGSKMDPKKYYDVTSITRPGMRDELISRMNKAGIDSVKRSEVSEIRKYIETKNEDYLPQRIVDALQKTEGKAMLPNSKDSIGAEDLSQLSKGKESELKDLEVSLFEWMLAPLEDSAGVTNANAKEMAKDVVPMFANAIRSNANINKKGSQWFVGDKPLFMTLLAAIGLVPLAAANKQ